MPFGRDAAGQEDIKIVWLLDEDGDAIPRPVRIGATDGKMSEIIGGWGLAEGTRVIVGFSESADGGSDAESQESGPGRPPGFRIF